MWAAEGTTSSGRRWRLETYGLTPLNAIGFSDGLNGVAVGDGGHIYATSNGWRDVTRPKTRAPSACTVHRGQTAKLKYRVNDIDSPLCRVTIRIRKLSGCLLKTIALGYRRAGRLCTVKWRCTLQVGTYRFRVTARDTAGNRQSVTGSNILHVVR